MDSFRTFFKRDILLEKSFNYTPSGIIAQADGSLTKSAPQLTVDEPNFEAKKAYHLLMCDFYAMVNATSLISNKANVFDPKNINPGGSTKLGFRKETDLYEIEQVKEQIVALNKKVLLRDLYYGIIRESRYAFEFTNAEGLLKLLERSVNRPGNRDLGPVNDYGVCRMSWFSDKVKVVNRLKTVDDAVAYIKELTLYDHIPALRNKFRSWMLGTVELAFTDYVEEFKNNIKMVDASPDIDKLLFYNLLATSSKAEQLPIVRVCRNMFSQLDWEYEYGSDAWVTICDAWINLNRSNNINSDVTLVDNIYDMQHNTGFVLNKAHHWKDKAAPSFQSLNAVGDLLDIKASLTNFNQLNTFAHKYCSGQVKQIVNYIIKALGGTASDTSPDLKFNDSQTDYDSKRFYSRDERSDFYKKTPVRNAKPYKSTELPPYKPQVKI